MKKPVTFRIDQELLDKARKSAQAENRTLTNFIETLLKMRVKRRTNSSGQPAGKM